MRLADDIDAVGMRAAAELAAVHDYYAETKVAWGIILNRIAAGDTFHSQNAATGTVTTHTELAGKVRGYVTQHLAESTFQQFLAVFEAFVSDLLRAWLTAYPHGIGGKELKFKDVLDAGDVPSLVARVVDHEVGEVTYKSPRAVFEYLKKRVGITPAADAEIDQLAEAKATRDVLVHNRGTADAEYQRKAGRLARFAAGDRVEIDEAYHRRTWELLRKMVAGIAAAATAKAT